MSHRRTSAFDDPLYHSFVVLENVQLWFFLREMCVRRNLIHGFCGAVRHWRLLLAHPTDRYKCSWRTDDDLWHLFFQCLAPWAKAHTRPIIGCRAGENRYYSTQCAGTVRTDWEQLTADTVRKSTNYTGICRQFDFQKCTKLCLMLILSLQDLLQSLNLEIAQSTMLSRISHMTFLAVITCEMIVGNKACHLSVTCLSPFRANLFTDHRMSGRPIRARYKHFKAMWEQTSDNSLYFPIPLFLIWWSSKQGPETLFCCSVFLFAISHSRSTHFRACPRTTLKFSREVCPILVISRLLQQKYETQTSFGIVQ